ncbi:MAG: hypothetical protein ACLQGU_02595 [bacterium]
MCKKVDLSFLSKRWPSGIVARKQIGQFTGGLMSPAHLANLDAQGAGPERIKIGGKVVYPVGELISWLEKRSCSPDEDAGD